MSYFHRNVCRNWHRSEIMSRNRILSDSLNSDHRDTIRRRNHAIREVHVPASFSLIYLQDQHTCGRGMVHWIGEQQEIGAQLGDRKGSAFNQQLNLYLGGVAARTCDRNHGRNTDPRRSDVCL